MKHLERGIHFINDNAMTIMALGAILALKFYFYLTPGIVACLWIVLTALHVAEEVYEDRKISVLFSNQLKPDGTWKVPTLERIRR